MVKKISISIAILLILFTAITIYGTTNDDRKKACLENGTLVVHESASDMEVINSSIPEVTAALKAISEGERKDLIWEYWFTPTSQEIVIENDTVECSETKREKNDRKDAELALIQTLINMPMDELKEKVNQSRLLNQEMRNVPSKTIRIDKNGNEIE